MVYTAHVHCFDRCDIVHQALPHFNAQHRWMMEQGDEATPTRSVYKSAAALALLWMTVTCSYASLLWPRQDLVSTVPLIKVAEERHKVKGSS